MTRSGQRCKLSHPLVFIQDVRKDIKLYLYSIFFFYNIVHKVLYRYININENNNINDKIYVYKIKCIK